MRAALETFQIWLWDKLVLVHPFMNAALITPKSFREFLSARSHLAATEEMPGMSLLEHYEQLATAYSIDLDALIRSEASYANTKVVSGDYTRLAMATTMLRSALSTAIQDVLQSRYEAEVAAAPEERRSFIPKPGIPAIS